MRAAVELAKDWRTDKYLRNLEALMIVADKDVLLILTGNGDVLEPEEGIAAIGSGGNYALSAAKALTEYEDDPEKIARRAMQVAAEVCVFTNDRVTLEEIYYVGQTIAVSWGRFKIASVKLEKTLQKVSLNLEVSNLETLLLLVQR